jgi:hypothetical protein
MSNKLDLSRGLFERTNTENLTINGTSLFVSRPNSKLNNNNNEKEEATTKEKAKKQEEIEDNTSMIIKKMAKEWFENTTSHGFSNIVKSRNWFGRILWISILMASVVYCFYSKSTNLIIA